MSGKAHKSVVAVGAVDSGKSTTVGHLIYKCGGVEKSKIDQFEKEATALGKGSFKYAWVLDNLKAERERGITIDATVTKFESSKYLYTIVDTPGHPNFAKNMMIGATQADLAVLVLDASASDLEADIVKSVHGLAMYIWMIKLPVIVVLNKMDAIGFSRTKYLDIKKVILPLLRGIGYRDAHEIPVIPISGWEGDNLTEASPNMSWYTGDSLLQALDNNVSNRVKPETAGRPLRIPLHGVCTIGGIGTVPVGRVSTGVLRPGIKAQFAPTGIVGEVKSIEMHHCSVPDAGPGDNVGFAVKGVVSNELRRGYVASDSNNIPACGAVSFMAQILVVNHPGDIKCGYTPIVYCGTATVPCKITNIRCRLDVRTAKVLEEKPKLIRKGESAIVDFEPMKPLCVESTFHLGNPELGRLVIRDLGRLVATGMVRDVTVSS